MLDTIMPIVTRTAPYTYALYADKATATMALEAALPGVLYLTSREWLDYHLNYIGQDLPERGPLTPGSRIAIVHPHQFAVHDVLDSGHLGRHIVTVRWQEATV